MLRPPRCAGSRRQLATLFLTDRLLGCLGAVLWANQLEGAIPRELCERWVAAGCAANGIDLADSSTWGERNVRAELSASMPEVAPRLHAAICQLCGGAGRVSNAAGLMLDAGFVVNYDQGADQPVRPRRSLALPILFTSPHPNRGVRGQWREPKGAAGGWYVSHDSYR